MNATDKASLLAALTAEETRRAIELADKLPDEVDITFEEAKMLSRVPVERWPRDLLAKIRDAIDLGDLSEKPSVSRKRK